MEVTVIMKKSLLVFMATLILTFAFATTCFAKVSPSATVAPTEEATTDDGTNEPNGPNDSGKSPKTGAETAIPMAVLITGVGIMFISRKKLSQAE